MKIPATYLAIHLNVEYGARLTPDDIMELNVLSSATKQLILDIRMLSSDE